MLSKQPTRSLLEGTGPHGSPWITDDAGLVRRPIALARPCVRELSDIREVSGSSREAALAPNLHASKKQTVASNQPAPPSRQPATPEDESSENPPKPNPQNTSRGLGNRGLSTLSLPLQDVPERRSSASVLGCNVSRRSSLQDFPGWRAFPSSTPAAGRFIPSRGRTKSPVRGASDRDAVSPGALRYAPSKTFIRTSPPYDILDNGNSRHCRVDMSTRLQAPLFVGGGTIEGHLTLTVDGGPLRKSKLKPIFISKLSIDVIGVEEVHDGRRSIFLSIASDLFDEQHPPPASLIETRAPSSQPGLLWQLKPATTALPFCLNLPLKLGPPPYLTKRAAIRYILCPTAILRTGEKQAIVRQTWNIQMLTVHDPEKALASLSNPLTASDSLSISNGIEVQHVKLTAGLHRQIWVNGAMIFVDLHVANKTVKSVKKVEIQLEKVVLWYSHGAAGTVDKSASHLRLAKKSDSEIVSISVLKKSKEWQGVLPNSSEVRTCAISVPRSHVTISTGRFFEVRYFINVIVAVTMFKSVTVQLPVILIHMNSLDIVPNSLAQVTASIEAKRARTVRPSEDGLQYPVYQPGQAFAAPRRQSLDRARNISEGLGAEEVEALTKDLDDSPRRFRRPENEGRRGQSALKDATSAENIPPKRPVRAPSSHHHLTRHPSCYHCHLSCSEHARPSLSSSAPAGPKLPRLRLSTSGLGFSDSEFEIPPNSPLRKVMLSESERKMLHQQNELRIQRQWFEENQRKPRARSHVSENERYIDTRDGSFGWRNVAVTPMTEPLGPSFGHSSHIGLDREARQKTGRAMSRETGPARTRSRTNPETFLSESRISRRAHRSMDWTGRPALRQSFGRPNQRGMHEFDGSFRYPRPDFEQRW